MYPESPLDGIPTGRNPHWTESPPNFMQWGFRTLVPGIPTGRNPHSSAHIAFLYTRYPIVARRAWPLGRVRRASKGILHTNRVYMYCNLALQRHCEL